jgi:hypothetical protein
MRDRLPLNHQTRDHVADCNHLIDKLILEVWYAKDNTEQKYVDELLQMEMEINSIYIKDQTSIDNLVDRLIRRIGKDASSRNNEITLMDLQTYLKDQQRLKKLSSIPRFCGEVTNWLFRRREEYMPLMNRQFDSLPRIRKDNQPRESKGNEKSIAHPKTSGQTAPRIRRSQRLPHLHQRRKTRNATDVGRWGIFVQIVGWLIYIQIGTRRESGQSPKQPRLYRNSNSILESTETSSTSKQRSRQSTEKQRRQRPVQRMDRLIERNIKQVSVMILVCA